MGQQRARRARGLLRGLASAWLFAGRLRQAVGEAALRYACDFAVSDPGLLDGRPGDVERRGAGQPASTEREPEAEQVATTKDLHGQVPRAPADREPLRPQTGDPHDERRVERA